MRIFYHNVEALLLVCASSFVFAASVPVSVQQGHFPQILIYFLSVLLFCALGSVYYLYCEVKQGDSDQCKLRGNSRAMYVVCVVIFIVGLILRLNLLDVFDIWLDEDSQMFFSAERVAILGAAVQQQPPIAYYLTALSAKIFPHQHLAARFFPILFALLSCVAFFILCLRHISGWWGVLAGGVFCLEPWLIRYSVEGRPYSIFIFFAVLYFSVVANFLLARIRPHHFIAMVSAGVLMFHSIGFQPSTIILTMAIVAAVFLFSKSQRRISMEFLISLFLIGILSMPTQLLLMLYGENHMKFNLSVDFSMLFKSDAYVIILPSLVCMSILFIVGGMSFDKFRTLHFKNLSLDHYSLLAMIIIYPLVSCILFDLFTEYYLFPRYLIGYIPLCIFTCAYLFKGVISDVDFVNYKKKLAQLFLCFCGLYGLALYLTHEYQNIFRAEGKYSRVKESWQGLYKVLDNESWRPGRAYLLNFLPRSKWSLDGFLAAYFYYSPQHQKPVLIADAWRGQGGGGVEIDAGMQIQNLMRDCRANKPIKTLFFVFDRGFNHIESINTKVHLKDVLNSLYSLETKVSQPDGFNVLQFNNVTDFRKVCVELFEQLNKDFVHEYSKSRVYEGLAYLAQMQGQKEKFEQALLKLRTLNFDGSLTSRIEDLTLMAAKAE